MRRLLTRLALALPRPRNGPLVNYGGASHARGGPLTKIELLMSRFPEHRVRFNIMYLLSAGRPDEELVACAKRRGVKVVVNQNGVYYPAVRPTDWQEANEPMRRMISLADYVFYQSRYARLAADKFLGTTAVGTDILYNAVDTEQFRPALRARRNDRFTLFTTGLLTNDVRVGLFEQLLEALRILRSRRADWRLVLATRFDTENDQAAARVLNMAQRLGLNDFISLSNAFSRSQAPSVYQQCDIYLHYMYNDCCPNSVLEAMACGLPVVYSASGGVPELVGDAAGIGIATPSDWDRIHAPDPDLYAKAISAVMDRHSEYAHAAREIAVAKFGLKTWIERHRTIFLHLLGEQNA